MGEPGTKETLTLEELEASAGVRTGRKHILSILVENKPGVLTRIDGELLRLIKDRGLAGGFLFEWADEWYRLAWNTITHQDASRPASGSSERYSAVRRGRIRFASPTIGICAGTFLEISAGSMSMWMNFARGANSDSLPVMRSSKRAPIATIRSASSIA